MTVSDEATAPGVLKPFALYTPRLVLLPTPWVISIPEYRSTYASLHAMPAFCTMAFGSHWLPRNWDSDKVTEVIQAEITHSWDKRQIGDFAVGLIPASLEDAPRGKQEFSEDTIAANFADVKWIGYCGLRDATTTSIDIEGGVDPASLYPPWQEMIELRYGYHPDSWGNGFGTEAARAIMNWGVEERGARRFIAETEILNRGSRGIMGKMGFTPSGTKYWALEETLEWECVVESQRTSRN